MVRLKFKAKNTAIHRMHPLCKLGWVGVILALALIFESPLYLIVLFCTTTLLVLAAQVFREWLTLMKLTLYLSVVIVVINALVNNQGDHIIVEAPFAVPVLDTLNLTIETIVFGLLMALRLAVIISAFAVVTFTIHPDDLLQALTRLRLPYKSVLVTALSTKFLPAVIEDAERIKNVQMARGIEFDRGGMIAKVRARLAIIVPLLSNSLDRAIQIAEAMESRAFGSKDKRTSYRQIKTSRIDVMTLGIVMIAGTCGVFMRISGLGGYQIYPELDRLDITLRECAMVLLLLALLSSIWPLAVAKKRIDLDYN